MGTTRGYQTGLENDGFRRDQEHQSGGRVPARSAPLALAACCAWAHRRTQLAAGIPRTRPPGATISELSSSRSERTDQAALLAGVSYEHARLRHAQLTVSFAT
jgi:hypothetical protein